jgi:hypothetical protein
MPESPDFDQRMREMLANDPVVTELCERIELQERHDLASLDDRDVVSYGELRAKGMAHGDAIVWLDRARPFREKR